MTANVYFYENKGDTVAIYTSRMSGDNEDDILTSAGLDFFFHSGYMTYETYDIEIIEN